MSSSARPLGGPAHIVQFADPVGVPYVSMNQAPGRDPAVVAELRRELAEIERQLQELETRRDHVSRRIVELES